MGKDRPGRCAEEGYLSSPERSLYGRRYGRPIRQERREALEKHLPEMQIEIPEEGLLDPVSLFSPAVQEVWLEIGSGNGEHAAWQASRSPSIGIIAVEPFVNGVANLLTIAGGEELHNIRVLDDDARLLLACLTPGSIARTFILFPDPWPKRRHWRRRIVSHAVLDQLAQVMPGEAELRVGTDHAEYLVWMLRVLRSHPGFAWLPQQADDWRRRPDDWPETWFEEKGREAGCPSTYLSLRRTGHASGASD